jgi:hypothetical protein
MVLVCFSFGWDLWEERGELRKRVNFVGCLFCLEQSGRGRSTDERDGIDREETCGRSMGKNKQARI